MEEQKLYNKPKQETLEYLFEVFKNEYNIECNKKTGLENHANTI